MFLGERSELASARPKATVAAARQSVFQSGLGANILIVSVVGLLNTWDQAGPRLSIKDRLSRYGDSRVKNKTAVRTSNL